MFKLWKKVMPTRAAASDVGVYANLDKLIEDPLPFALNGKVHFLKPIKTIEFYSLANAIFEFNNMKTEDITADRTVDKLYDLVHSLCDTITKKDIENLQQMQLSALYMLIMEHAKGKSHGMSQDDLKKKMTAMYQA